MIPIIKTPNKGPLIFGNPYMASMICEPMGAGSKFRSSQMEDSPAPDPAAHVTATVNTLDSRAIFSMDMGFSIYGASYYGRY